MGRSVGAGTSRRPRAVQWRAVRVSPSAPPASQWRFATGRVRQRASAGLPRVESHDPDAAALFYDRLFETLPDARPLFGGDMAEQGRKLMATLALVVRGLDRLDQVLPAARALALRHVDYGVRAEHYPPVGAALLWTLERGLGDAFTPETADAWRIAYGALSTAMIEAASPAAAAS